MPAVNFQLRHTSGWVYQGTTKQTLAAKLTDLWRQSTRPLTTKQTKVKPLLELMKRTKKDEWTMEQKDELKEEQQLTGLELSVREFNEAELLNVNERNKHALADFGASTDTLTPQQWERIAYYEEARLAESTQRAYKGVMKAFSEFWASRFSHLHPDQCTDAEVRLFLTEGADEGLSNSTLELRLACLQGHLKTLSDEQWQKVHDCVISIRKRRAGDPRFESKGKDALLTADLKVCLATIQGDGLLDVRNRSLLLLMWFSAMRRSEVSALCWRHLTCKDNGVVIRISKAKADQQGFGQDVGIAAKPDEPNRCPLRALLAWRDLLKPEPNDPVFPHINAYTHELARQTPMGGDRIYRLVKETCAAAGLDPQRFAPHSFRSGLLTQSATNGVAIEKLKAHARHANCDTTLHYVRASEILGPDCLTNKV